MPPTDLPELITHTDWNLLFAQLAAQSNPVILTPNQRLSRFLQQQYNHWCQRQHSHQQAWVALPCHAYNHWLQQLWQHLLLTDESTVNNQRLLSSFQEQLIWQQLLEQRQDMPLLNTQAAARQLLQAWQLQQQWQLPEAETVDNNYQLLQQLAADFIALCQQKSWLSAATLPEIINTALAQQKLVMPEQLFLYGFDEFMPQQAQLWKNLLQHGTDVKRLTIVLDPAERAPAKRHHFADSQQELEACANWCSQLLQQADITKPLPRIAVVVPDLAQQRQRVIDSFSREFEPQYLLPEQPQHAPGFNLSAGEPLAQLPIVAAALEILAFNQPFVPIEALSRILCSVFVGKETELAVRVNIDLELREAALELSLPRLLKIIEHSKQKATYTSTAFYQALKNFIKLSAETKSKRHCSEWIEIFLAQLGALGWPGERPLDTLEYQQLSRFRQVLDEFAGLDDIVGAVSFNNARQILQRLLNQSSFQAQTRQSPIQILGLLEAAGQHFDYLWFLNLDDETWPAAPNPNPFLPIAQQIEYQIPHCCAERELVYAQRLTEGFLSQNKQVIFSHGLGKEDKQLAASPLIATIVVEKFLLAAPTTAVEQLYAAKKLQLHLDAAVPVTETELKGGSDIIKSQAQCPFLAFAKYRLLAKEFPATEVGLNGKERGSLVHSLLENIWNQLGNQKALLALSDKQLETCLDEHIDSVIDQFNTIKASAGERLLVIEKQRLKTLLLKWFDLEKQRADFSVLSHESKLQLQMAGLTINIRVDRIDQLADHGLMVLDYKTAEVKPQDWLTDRPNEPQVPLYCLAIDASREFEQAVVVAAFGQLNVKQVAFKGVAANEELQQAMLIAINKRNPMVLPVLQQDWQKLLPNLAEQFMAGEAAVDPKNSHQSCQYCEMTALCRIQEIKRAQNAPAE